MALAQADPADEDDVGGLVDELQTEEVLDLQTVEFLGPVSLELVEGLTHRESGEAHAPFDGAVLSAVRFALDESVEGVARPTDPSRPYPGNEWSELPPQPQPRAKQGLDDLTSASPSCRTPVCTSGCPGTGKPSGTSPWPRRPALTSRSVFEPAGSAGAGLTSRGAHRMGTSRTPGRVRHRAIGWERWRCVRQRPGRVHHRAVQDGGDRPRGRSGVPSPTRAHGIGRVTQPRSSPENPARFITPLGNSGVDSRSVDVWP